MVWENSEKTGMPQKQNFEEMLQIAWKETL